MKKLLLFLILHLAAVALYSQALKRIADRAGRKVESKIGQKVDKKIDESVDGKKGKTASKDSKKSSENGGSEDESESEEAGSETASGSKSGSDSKPAASATPSLATYSKFDFVPGDKIIQSENFTTDAVGDFPANWNTNSSAEIVTLNNREGKWIKLNKRGLFHPENFKELPENFTLEFDIGTNTEFSYYSTELNIALTRMVKPREMYYRTSHTVNLELHPLDASFKKGRSRLIISKDGTQFLDNKVEMNSWTPKINTISHVSIWRQKQRLRVYVNEEKIWDIPRAFEPDQEYDAIVLNTGSFYKPEDYFILSNIVLSVGSPDTRNKLLKEGRFVTRGILFDVNSDKIKPQSYGVLKDIASVMKETPDLKLRIIGHTDSDGDDKSNLDLSKRRAASVRKALSGNFEIDESRLETDGKGESEPATPNDTPEGKANNRRVEFVKL